MLSRTYRCFSSAAGGHKIGFLGLGNMGLFMAKNLMKSGAHVKGFDVCDKALANAKAAGVHTQASLGEAVKGVDYVVTCLPKTEHVKHAIMGDGGVFAHADKGTMICDTSTISPMASKEFAAEAPKHGLTFLDTPMSGGTAGAEAGTLTFMVGSESEADFEKSKLMLQGMGKNIFHCGGPGTGEIAKIVNNMILGVIMIGTSEGFAIGEKLGADPKLMQQICAVSSSRGWVMDTMHPVPGVLPNSPASKGYAGGFMSALVKKDMALAMSVADEVGADKSIAEFCHAYYKDLEDKGKGDLDFGYTFQYIKNGKKVVD